LADSSQHLPPSQQQSPLSQFVQTQAGHSHGTGAAVPVDPVSAASFAADGDWQQADFSEQQEADFSLTDAATEVEQVLPAVQTPAGHPAASHPSVAQAAEQASICMPPAGQLPHPPPLAEHPPAVGAGTPAINAIAESVTFEKLFVPLAAMTPPIRSTLASPAASNVFIIV